MARQVRTIYTRTRAWCRSLRGKLLTFFVHAHTDSHVCAHCVCGVAGLRLRLHHFHSGFVLILVLLSVCVFLNSVWHWQHWGPPSLPSWSWGEGVGVGVGQHRLTQNPAKAKAKPQVPCDLPQLDPFDPSVLEFLEPAPQLDCSSASDKHPKLFRTDFNNKLIRMVKVEGRCCYKTLERTEYSDLITKFSKRCTRITRIVTIIPLTVEFIQVQCEVFDEEALGMQSTNPRRERSLRHTANGTRTTYVDMFAFVPHKPEPGPSLPLPAFPRTTHAAGADQLNVVILGLDGQSHMNFIRQMPRTYKYLMDKQNLSQGHDGTSHVSAPAPVTVIEMNGYAKVGDNTFPNLVPLLTGLSVPELVTKCWSTQFSYFDGCPFIWKKYTEASARYKTLYAEDSVWMGIFQYEKLGFYKQPTDYYLNPFVLQLGSKLGHEATGNTKLCYGPRLAFEVLLDYMVKSFVRFGNSTASKQRFFEFIWANSLFHDYLNHPKLGDKLLYMTLEWLISHNYMNQTLLILASDHGARWGSMRSTYQGMLEERLPMLYFILPSWFQAKYSVAVHNLMENRNRLTTPFDVHETLLDLLDVAKNLGNDNIGLRNGPEFSYSRSPTSRPRGLSLFRPIPATRICAEAGVAGHWCICSRMTRISTSAEIVEEAAHFVVASVNQIISNFNSTESGHRCAKLSLERITSAMKKIDVDGAESGKVEHQREESVSVNNQTTTTAATIELQLSLSVTPSKAVLEATVYKNEDTGFQWALSGEISRLNLYGDQSSCISDPVLEKYCYCIGDTNGNWNRTTDNDITGNTNANWYEDNSS